MWVRLASRADGYRSAMTDATSADHVLVRTAESPGESAFECLDGCGRQIVVRHDPPEIVVLGKGDARALHRWADFGVGFAASVTQD
jgi:hypothetical protein